MTTDELKAILELSKAQGCTEVVVEGITFRLAPIVQPKPDKEQPRAIGPVEDAKATDLIKPLSTFDEPSDEDVLYYATDYYDVLQAKKADMEKRKKDGVIDG